jgi:signal-transduction protein with cAMP-binding, CBS, and nucleotidyltransferase domain
MKEILLQFLSQFNELTENQVQELAQHMNVLEVKKNTTLVKEGQTCNVCYFILKGCLRQYVLHEGVEKTISIYTENQAVNFFSMKGEQQKSESYLITVEDAVILVGDPEKDIDLYTKFPVFS